MVHDAFNQVFELVAFSFGGAAERRLFLKLLLRFILTVIVHLPVLDGVLLDYSTINPPLLALVKIGPVLQVVHVDPSFGHLFLLFQADDELSHQYFYYVSFAAIGRPLAFVLLDVSVNFENKSEIV